MKKRILILACAIGLLNMSCEDYLDVNTSPNNPTGENVPANLVLAGAMETIFPTQSNTMNRLGNAFMNTWGPNVNSFTGGFADEFSLAIDNTFYSGIWSGLYLGINPFQAIINSEGTTFNNHKAIAMVMKSFYMQYIVDLYGNVPYSQAFLRGENLTPAYDNDMDIYMSLMTQLDDAIALIEANNGAVVGNEDIIFEGDMGSWVRFANTVKLKMLIRLSTKAQAGTDAALTTYVADEFTLLDQNFVSQDVTINPGYSDDSNDRLNPFYGTYGFDNEGNVTTTNNFIRGSEYAIQFLQGATGTGVNDPRLGRIYAANSAGNFVGIQQGEDNAATPLSGVGPGLIVSADQNGFVMTAAEAFFLQAEARFHGYLTGDPAQAYNDGIQASFDLLGAGDASAYFGNAGVSYTAASNKIEAIMTQKWIAVNGINAIESWIDYTRTGFPVVPLPTSAQFTDKPNRLMYPNSEYSGNAANVPTQTQADAFSTKIFWDN
jgi:hypothetical protein